MRKKKEPVPKDVQKFFITVSLLIIFAIAFLFLILFLSNSQKDSFTITQEVCHDKNIEITNGFSEFTIYYRGKTEPINYYFEKTEQIEKITYQKQICEQKEVAEIEYVYDEICYGCKENPNDCQEKCLKDANICLDKYSVYEDSTECEDFLHNCWEECQSTLCNFDCEKLSTNIQKHSLTKEWLNKNAECVEGKKIRNWKGNIVGESIDECSKYKIGNYTIEVK